MPWKEQNMEKSKKQFVELYALNFFTMTDLCEKFKISRQSGYKILNAYKMYGDSAFSGLSKAHKSHPNTTSKKVVDALLELREEHKTWGAKKLRQILIQDSKLDGVPSETTVNNILKKHGYVKSRRKRFKNPPKLNPKFDPSEPNEIMSADFKGRFRMRDNNYCNPLTIADSFTRFVFAVAGLKDPSGASARPVFDRVFRENGLPKMIHTDNGSPFGCISSLRRMTYLSVWFMELGIIPVYSDPGCPTQNGRHERMHRDLKAEATRPPGLNLKDQQRLFDEFVYNYNYIRPHEALDMKKPCQIHKSSPREYNGKIEEWIYTKDFDVKMVNANGHLRWGNKNWVRVTNALNGKFVGLKRIADRVWEIYFRNILIGYFSEETMKTYESDNFNF